MFGEKTKIVVIALILSVSMALGTLYGVQVLPYYATDPNNVPPSGTGKAPNSLDPLTGWSNPIDDGNGPQIGPIKPGQVVWLSFNNIPDPTRKKHFKLELKKLKGSLGNVTIIDAIGFADANSNYPMQGTATGNVNNRHDTEVIRAHYKFNKQPRWEKFRLVNNTRNDVTFTVEGWSICGKYTGDWHSFKIERGSFGGEGIMVSYEAITEVHCFPESVDMDFGIMPSMTSDPPGSGPWWTSPLPYDSLDPEGETRPHGGIRYYTTGAGILPGDLFDLSFGMSFGPDEEKDVRYFIFTYDTAGVWDKYVLDFTDELCDGEIMLGDFNKDCWINFPDFAKIAANWLRCNDPCNPTCAPEDKDGDGWDSTIDCDDNNPDINPDASEICDGLDNDCDGATDEDFPGIGTACSEGIGQCERSGTIVCSPDQTGTICNAVAGEPSIEICDGLDNDCDGAVDEGDPGGGGACNTGLLGICSSGTQHCQSGAIQCVQDNMPSSEVCDGLDNDCNPASADGSEDPMTGTACDGPDSDLCDEGTYSCVGGSLSCSDNTSSTVDLCNGMDDDCDGSSPDGSEETWYGAACDGSDSDMCLEGLYECVAGQQICTDNTGHDLDLCDGYDNDCDGSSADGSEETWYGAACDGPDSDLCEEGIYVCSGGSQTCTDNTSSTYEICNHQDDDCDGQVDEGITCECYNNNDNECPCSGNPRSCSSYGLQDCNNQPGCSWKFFSCTGTAAPCDSYDRGECESHDGCHLEYCDNGDCHY